jgi:4-aminobutyrate aminotransferase
VRAAEPWLSFPDAPRLRVPPPGPKSKELLGAQAAYETDAVVYPRYFPIAIAQARGATIEDVDGNRFIDWLAGISVLNLGHGHPRLRAALERQADRIWHALEIPTEARIEFLKRLSDALPGTLRNRSKVLFTVTGGDAVETAVSLADFAQKRHGTVAFSGAYHGVHGGALSLTSGRKYHHTQPFRGGTVVRVPFPDPYRPVFGDGESATELLGYLEHLASDPHSGVDEISAVAVEPILGEGGYVVPPDDFLPGLREFCDRHGVLLILDEVQSGMGRTGKMWASEHWGVTPDIVCMAKTVGGGIPLSVVAYREDLVRELPRGFHLGTYRGNPLALAVGAEVLAVLSEEPWIERAARLGPRLIERFRDVQSRHPAIGDVRGKGFMIGVEFVRDPRSKEPWGERAKEMRRELFGRGVLMHTCGSHDQVMRFMAPLVIEDELLERGLSAFEEAATALEGVPPSVRRVVRGREPSPGLPPEPFPEPRLPPVRPSPFHPSPASPPPGRTIP